MRSERKPFVPLIARAKTVPGKVGVVVVIVALIAVWVFGVEKAFGAESPSTPSTTTSEPRAPLPVSRRLPTSSAVGGAFVVNMYPAEVGDYMARRFRSGAMRNSHGIRLPYHVRHQLARKVDTRAERRHRWWRYTLNTGACISNMGGTQWSASYCVITRQWRNREQYRWWKRTTKVKLECGGAAAFGYVGGAWKGAVLGGAGCAWAKVVGLW